MKKIAIIGSGQLGSRHLQSLAKLGEEFELYIVDPSVEALKIALERFEEVRGKNTSKVTALQQIEHLPPLLNLAIIACNSLQRRMAIENLYKVSKCDLLILEKFLFPALEDYEAIGKLLKTNNVKAWVNCPRRMYSDYQKIKGVIGDISDISIQVSAGQLGLGSNAIHHIDLFKFLGGGSIKSIQTDSLKQKIYASKRNGYIEFYGTLKVNAQNGTLSITSFEHSDLPLTISITTATCKVLIQESKGPFALISKKENNWEKEEISFTFQHQSELTQIAVSEIFSKGTCSLPIYDESASIHKLLLESYHSFYNKVGNTNEKLCPIT